MTALHCAPGRTTRAYEPRPRWHTQDMIVRRLPDVTLMDREALSQWLQRPATTIRARCTPIAHDTDSRRALYDTEQVREALAGRRRWRTQSQPRTVGP